MIRDLESLCSRYEQRRFYGTSKGPETAFSEERATLSGVCLVMQRLSKGLRQVKLRE